MMPWAKPTHTASAAELRHLMGSSRHGVGAFPEEDFVRHHYSLEPMKLFAGWLSQHGFPAPALGQPLLEDRELLISSSICELM